MPRRTNRSLQAHVKAGAQGHSLVVTLGRAQISVLMRNPNIGAFLKGHVITHRLTGYHVTELNNEDLSDHILSDLRVHWAPRHHQLIMTLCALAHNLKPDEESIDAFFARLGVTQMPGFNAARVKKLMLFCVKYHSVLESKLQDVLTRTTQHNKFLGLLKNMMRLDRPITNYATICRLGVAYLS